MKKVIVLLSFVFCFLAAAAQDQGIGLRIGDPTGVTYKKYFGKTRAVEFGIGTNGPGWHHGYYENSFGNHGSKFDGYGYRSHKVRSTVYLQGRYLIQNNIYIQGMEGKWDWYWGVGALMKIASVEYHFVNDSPPFNDSEVYNDIDLGPEGIAGMEYTFQGVPITVFGEVSLMLEIVDRVTLRPFSGVGARYRF